MISRLSRSTAINAPVYEPVIYEILELVHINQGTLTTIEREFNLQLKYTLKFPGCKKESRLQIDPKPAGFQERALLLIVERRERVVPSPAGVCLV